MASQTISLHCDASQVLADLKLLSDAADRSPQIRKRLLDLGNLGPELIRLDADDVAGTGAGEFGIRLQPSDLLLELVATVRADELDSLVVQEIRHE